MSDGETSIPGRGLEFAPPPASFPVPDVDVAGRDLRSISTDGVAVLLSETQADLTGPDRVVTVRLVRAITGRNGLESVARFDPVFDPRFQRLVVHGIRVIRNGVQRDEARPEAFELMRRELNLERAIYDGRVTAHMVIPDLREGDVVDYCYSVIGEQPSLRGTFFWFFVLQWSMRALETVCRVIARPDQKMLMRRFGGAPEPRVGDSNGRRIYTWRVRDLAPYKAEPFAPPWSVGYQAVEIGLATTWDQVSDRFREMYEGAIADGSPPSELAAEVEAIRSRSGTAAGRAVEGLRLVQRTLRYHSVAIGDGGFRPRPLRTIWSTRYGDCKDASVLLTSVLRQLGLDACCALVNVGLGDDLNNAIPSAGAFNHCIVRLHLDGRDYWLDGTMPPQAGDLAHLTQGRYGWALPLVPQARLTRIAPAPLQLVREVVETWTFPQSTSGTTRLETSTINRVWRADETRRLIDNRDAVTLAELYREQFERELQSPLRQIGSLDFTDDAATNALTVREVYEVEQPFAATSERGRQFVSYDDVIRPNLPMIEAGPRREPIALGSPRQLTTRREFNFPVANTFPPWDERIEGPGGLEARTTFEWFGARRGVHTVSLTVPGGVISPQQSEAYRSFLERVLATSGISFVLPTQAGRFVRPPTRTTMPWPWIAWITAIVLAMAVRWFTGG